MNTIFIKIPYHGDYDNVLAKIIDLAKVRSIAKIDSNSLNYIKFIFTENHVETASFKTRGERDEFYNRICGFIITEI